MSDSQGDGGYAFREALTGLSGIDLNARYVQSLMAPMVEFQKGLSGWIEAANAVALRPYQAVLADQARWVSGLTEVSRYLASSPLIDTAKQLHDATAYLDNVVRPAVIDPGPFPMLSVRDLSGIFDVAASTRSWAAIGAAVTVAADATAALPLDGDLEGEIVPPLVAFAEWARTLPVAQAAELQGRLGHLVCALLEVFSVTTGVPNEVEVAGAWVATYVWLLLLWLAWHGVDD